MTALREEYPHTSVEALCSLFGKRRQWYYKKSTVVVSENQRAKLLTALIEYYRGLCPRIGGVKLYLLLASDLGKEVTHGRDAFLKFYAEKNFRLPRNKPIHTTNSNHVYRKYPNLVKGLEVRHVNHVWVADITYVWIEGDVLYLHLLTDAFSHAVIGWCLTDTLEAEGTVKALEMGIMAAGGGNLCATIHHSDRGTQYACYRYVDTLVGHHIRISMLQAHRQRHRRAHERHPQDGMDIPPGTVPRQAGRRRGHRPHDTILQRDTPAHEHWNARPDGGLPRRGTRQEPMEKQKR